MEQRRLEGKEEGEMVPPGGASVAILNGPLAQLTFQNFIAASLASCICAGTGSSLLLQRPYPSRDKPVCTSSVHARITSSRARCVGVWVRGHILSTTIASDTLASNPALLRPCQMPLFPGASVLPSAR